MISPRSFVALQHRNFRLIWIGLLLSMTGSMMQTAALLWQVSLLVVLGLMVLSFSVLERRVRGVEVVT